MKDKKTYDWPALYLEYKASGKSIYSFARSMGIHSSLAYHHLGAMERSEIGACAYEASETNNGFIELDLTDPSTENDRSAGSMVINAGKLSVKVQTGYDQAFLSGILKVMVSAC